MEKAARQTGNLPDITAQARRAMSRPNRDLSGWRDWDTSGLLPPASEPGERGCPPQWDAHFCVSLEESAPQGRGPVLRLHLQQQTDHTSEDLAGFSISLINWDLAWRGSCFLQFFHWRFSQKGSTEVWSGLKAMVNPEVQNCRSWSGAQLCSPTAWAGL